MFWSKSRHYRLSPLPLLPPQTLTHLRHPLNACRSHAAELSRRMSRRKGCLDAKGSDLAELALTTAQRNHSLLGDTAVLQVPPQSFDRA